MPTAAKGRADLFLALARDGEAGLAAMAELLDYEALPKRPAPRQTSEEPRPAPADPAPSAEPAESPAVGFQPVTFWRQVTAELSSEDPLMQEIAPTKERKVADPTDDDFVADEDAIRPVPAPIVGWPRLWRTLDDCLRTPIPRQEIDVARLVSRWARVKTWCACRAFAAWRTPPW